MDKNFKKQNTSEIMKLLSMLTHLGYVMVTPIILCIIGGAWLDTFFSIQPLCLIIGVLFGVAAAFRNLFYFSQKFGK